MVLIYFKEETENLTRIYLIEFGWKSSSLTTYFKKGGGKKSIVVLFGCCI